VRDLHLVEDRAVLSQIVTETCDCGRRYGVSVPVPCDQAEEVDALRRLSALVEACAEGGHRG